MGIKTMAHPRKRVSIWIPAFAGMTMLASSALAAPPTGISLTYDFDKSSLHVSARHPSDNMDKNYLRRLVIYRNGMEEQALTFARQKIAAGLEEDVSLSASPGDLVRVEIFASEGGKGSAEITLTAPQSEGGPATPPSQPPAHAPRNDY